MSYFQGNWINCLLHLVVISVLSVSISPLFIPFRKRTEVRYLMLYCSTSRVVGVWLAPSLNRTEMPINYLMKQKTANLVFALTNNISYKKFRLLHLLWVYSLSIGLLVKTRFYQFRRQVEIKILLFLAGLRNSTLQTRGWQLDGNV